MKYQLYKQDAYKESPTVSGSCRELAIYPAGSTYLERNFLWRLHMDRIETEETDFSRLPDYDRVLMVLEGETVLSHQDQRVARLKAMEQERFDGAYKTRSFGKVTDFNLMVRKGNEGYLDLLYPEKNSVRYGSSQESEKPKAVHGLYCLSGYLVVTFGGESVMVKEGELLVLQWENEPNLSYSIMGEGVSLRAQIFFDEMEGELSAEVIPAEKTSWDDFKTCIYLANIQFRLAKYIVPSLKTTWFDEALTSAIGKVERFYLTYLAFLIGAMGVSVFSIAHLNGWQTGLALVLWLLVDCLVVSPLIYLPFMPKPVRKHIKDVDKLTPYEQRVRQEQLGKNQRVEKLIKKYQYSGKNLPK